MISIRSLGRTGAALAGLWLVVLTVGPAAAQPDWIQRATVGSQPAPRSSHAMAYDPVRRKVVVFGGSAFAGVLNDTWEWDGIAWTQHQPAASPGPRTGHVMAFDGVRGRVMLFGGIDATNMILNDTWEWDGVNWSQVHPSASPPVRMGAVLTYDSTRRRAVLFGGSSSTSLAMNDTWEWDGITWLLRQPAFSPTARSGAAMAYDASRQRTVLFGGSLQNDTWEWDGVIWTRSTPATSPLARSYAAMAFHAGRQRTVLIGGSAYFPDETWEWDGVTWSKRATHTRPPGPSNQTMVYDAARECVVLFGGYVMNVGLVPDAWEYGFNATLTSHGTPRPGNPVGFTLLALGDRGWNYQLGSSLGGGPIAIGGRTLGLGLDALLALSTSGQVPGVFQHYRGAMDSTGQAAATLQIPAAPGLVGFTIHSAFVTLNPAATLGIQSISNTVSFLIVP